MKQTHFTAEFFYKNFRSIQKKEINLKANRQQFYRLVVEYDIDFIQLWHGPRLYSLKDWNKKTPAHYHIETPEENNVQQTSTNRKIFSKSKV